MIKEKSKFWQKFSLSIGKLFSKLPITPNTYSVLTTVPAFLGLSAVIYQKYILATFLFGLSGLLDIVDGAVARATHKTSHYGAFLDGSLDRFVDFALIFSYFWVPLHTPLLSKAMWISIAVFVAIMPSFEVAYANHRQAVDDPHEKKVWRILNRGEMYPLMLAVIFFAIFNVTLASYIFVFWVLLSVITTIQTIWVALRLARKESPFSAFTAEND